MLVQEMAMFKEGKTIINKHQSRHRKGFLARRASLSNSFETVSSNNRPIISSKLRNFTDFIYFSSTSPSHQPSIAKKHHFLSRYIYLHNRQHGFGGNYDCVSPAREAIVSDSCSDHLPSVDNSESSRNGDYVPSRWDAQADAANLIFQYKTQANPESSVGLMTMGGSGPEVLTTLTTNPGKVLDGLHRTKIRGESHLHTAIMIASVCCNC